MTPADIERARDDASTWLQEFYEHAVYISPESQRVFDIVHRLCQALDHQKPVAGGGVGGGVAGAVA